MTGKEISLRVNGTAVNKTVLPRLSLADFLRCDLGLTGTHLGCEHGVCGACTVRLDGSAVRSCLVLAVQADGHSVETIEGISESGAAAKLQESFHRHNALQCGFCTSGMLVSALELLAKNARPSRDQVRDGISGNYCRCTGYHAIVDAIMDVL